MTVQRHDRPHPYIERTFTAVRAALAAANVAAFDTELEAITHVPVVDLAARWRSSSPGGGASPSWWARRGTGAGSVAGGRAASRAGPGAGAGAAGTVA
jgi:hypothetical protein